ncbi:DNA integrity scanning diadenylate cyclase DisA [Falsarthrobacter nasiphocae]|uniref:Diadenylate cyclase n=1 Tax=Falsarthrobacter nasiphocae TaxID=189863 RepID=A0AAE4C6A8_9MICC|nr:DNA integrity scanning diadenylate cyclase DisA [Falsarthrobacter nasiphocae]MDR6891952.1 diadenylate cyclase [Falsarthrobacter nasiphocae]
MPSANESTQRDSLLRETLKRVAPGTPLREGLERILRGRTGALIVLGEGPEIDSISHGGFVIDTEFTPARLRELAKMDGGIVLSRDGSRIRSAAVHLLPQSATTATESGTRHRTAEQTSLATGMPVITVSASMNIISLFTDGTRYALDRPELILERANQALNTLERYRERLESVMHHLTQQELEATVSVRELATAVQRQEMVRRIIHEISTYTLELGAEGRLVTLQLEELASGTEGNTELLLRDYAGLDIHDRAHPGAEGSSSAQPTTAGAAPKAPQEPASPKAEAAAAKATAKVIADQLAALAELTSAELVDLSKVAAILGVESSVQSLDRLVQPRGHRILGQIRNLPRSVSDRIVARFDGLQGLLAASTEELMSVDGVGEQRARIVRETLSRMAELNFFEHY